MNVRGHCVHFLRVDLSDFDGGTIGFAQATSIELSASDFTGLSGNSDPEPHRYQIPTRIPFQSPKPQPGRSPPISFAVLPMITSYMDLTAKIHPRNWIPDDWRNPVCGFLRFAESGLDSGVVRRVNGETTGRCAGTRHNRSWASRGGFRYSSACQTASGASGRVYWRLGTDVPDGRRIHPPG